MQRLNSPKVFILLFIWTLSLGAAITLSKLIPTAHHSEPISSAKKIASNQIYRGDQLNKIPTKVFTGPRQLIDYLDIKIRFNISNYSPYANIFQTSSHNEGVRLELIKISEKVFGLLLIIGDASTDNPYAVKISENLSIGEEYSLRVHMDYWGSMQIYFNDKLVHTVSKNVKPVISNVILGNGFDGTRSFLGRVTLDNLELMVSDYLGNPTKEGGLINKISSFNRIENIYSLFGIIMSIVNFAVSLRLFYYVWYEP